ncbi:MAG: hypothetical protein WCK92_13430 [Bacteroidota bacterium]
MRIPENKETQVSELVQKIRREAGICRDNVCNELIFKGIYPTLLRSSCEHEFIETYILIRLFVTCIDPSPVNPLVKDDNMILQIILEASKHLGSTPEMTNRITEKVEEAMQDALDGNGPNELTPGEVITGIYSLRVYHLSADEDAAYSGLHYPSQAELSSINYYCDLIISQSNINPVFFKGNARFSEN